MPGIVGIYTKMPRGWAEPQLLRMVEALRHENFYVTGTWVDEALGIYVGWVERKNSFCGGMPVRNDRGDMTLVFSGEEFPEPALKVRYKDRGRQSDSSEASYLLHLYQEDKDFPANLNGRFHGLVADRRRGSIMLFNDRFGMHRLHHHSSKDAFYFAAEAKAILAVRPDLRRISPRALGEYIICGCVLEGRTLFEDIQTLPCASKWTFENGSVKNKSTYFNPQEWEQQEILEPDKYYNDVRDVFSQNLSRYFESQEQIGLSLTGGLDTRMILAWHNPHPWTLPSYTFGGMFRDCRDVIVARRVAQACNQTHKIIPVGMDFLSCFDRYAERTVYLSDGCADVRRSSDLFLNERVREIASIRMTGNYGSEVLRAVRAFKPTKPMHGLFKKDLQTFFDQADVTYQNMLGNNPVSFAVFKQAPWYHYGLLALEQTQVSIRTPYLDNNLVRTVFRAPQATFGSADLCLRLIEEGSPTLRRIPSDTGIGGAGIFGALSQRLLEFIKKAEYAYDYGMPQWMARLDHRVSWFHFERLFLGWHKFNHFRVWYRDILANYIRQMLLDPRTLSRPYLCGNRVETMVEGHLKGTRNYTTELHAVLSLELLHRLFVDPR